MMPPRRLDEFPTLGRRSPRPDRGGRGAYEAVPAGMPLSLTTLPIRRQR